MSIATITHTLQTKTQRRPAYHLWAPQPASHLGSSISSLSTLQWLTLALSMMPRKDSGAQEKVELIWRMCSHSGHAATQGKGKREHEIIPRGRWEKIPEVSQQAWLAAVWLCRGLHWLLSLRHAVHSGPLQEGKVPFSQPVLEMLKVGCPRKKDNT